MLPKKLLAKIGISSILLLSGSLLSPASAAPAPNYVEGTDAAAVVFDPLKVNNFELEMSDEDFNRLTYPNVSWDNEGPWLETVMKFTMENKVYGPYTVGVHLKGAWGSWRDIYGKAAFKIKMNAFVKKQKLFGITKFTLNNMVQDPSYIHESLTYRLFRAVGVPTPRVGYANVTLNGRDYGLHLNIETVDTTMLNRWGLTNTHLYKGGVPHFPELYSGNEPYFQVEDGSETNRQDLTRFLDTMTNFSGEQWWEEITQIANMREITLDIATEAYVGHWDGYPYNRNNYYITFDENGYAHLMPWGVDQTWDGGMDYFGSVSLLFQRCQTSESCKEMYLQAMAEVSRVANSLKLDDMAVHVSAAIREDIVADPWGPGIDAATYYQQAAIWNVRNQYTSLSNRVRAWDTGISNVLIDGVRYPADQIIKLPPSADVVEIKAVPFQAYATGDTVIVEDLQPGLNVTEVQVTSVNRSHMASHEVNLYRLTNRSGNSTLSYFSNSVKMPKASITKVSQLKSRFVDSVNLNLTITMAKPKNMSLSNARTLLSRRVALLSSSLKAAGVEVSGLKKLITTTGSSDSLKVYYKYMN
jgi:hypothetical protein